MFRTLATATLVALSFTAAWGDDFSTQVSFADLDLSRPADAMVMEGRVEDAARTVCEKANPKTLRALEHCIDKSVDMALTQIQDGRDEISHDKLVRIRMAANFL